MSSDEKQLIKNTIKTEQSQLQNMVRRLGSKLSGLMITCGFLVLTYSVYILIVPPDPALLATLGWIFTGALGFIGGLNLLCGLLLLLGED